MFDTCIAFLSQAFEGGTKSMENDVVEQCIQGAALLARVRPTDVKLGSKLHALEKHRHQLQVWKKIWSEAALLRNQRVGYKRYNKVICGSELVDWMLGNGSVADKRQACAMGKELFRFGLSPVGDFPFENNKNLYSVVEDPEYIYSTDP